MSPENEDAILMRQIKSFVDRAEKLRLARSEAKFCLSKVLDEDRELLKRWWAEEFVRMWAIASGKTNIGDWRGQK